MAGFPENIGISATTLTYDWILSIFSCLLVKTNLFVYDENHVFRLETFCLDRWLAGYPKKKLSQLHPQPGMSPMLFWCLLIKVNNFAFDEDAVLWPETTCLDKLVVVGGWLDFLTI